MELVQHFYCRHTETLDVVIIGTRPNPTSLNAPFCSVSLDSRPKANNVTAEVKQKTKTEHHLPLFCQHLCFVSSLVSLYSTCHRADGPTQEYLRVCVC